jgi:uncharacterized Zn finger protein (UPF0148 family)
MPDNEEPGVRNHADESRQDDKLDPRKPAGADPERPAKCDLCGAVMIERQCRLVCPACGYERDCSDP